MSCPTGSGGRYRDSSFRGGCARRVRVSRGPLRIVSNSDFADLSLPLSMEFRDIRVKWGK